MGNTRLDERPHVQLVWVVDDSAASWPTHRRELQRAGEGLARAAAAWRLDLRVRLMGSTAPAAWLVDSPVLPDALNLPTTGRPGNVDIDAALAMLSTSIARRAHDRLPIALVVVASDGTRTAPRGLAEASRAGVALSAQARAALSALVPDDALFGPGSVGEASLVAVSDLRDRLFRCAACGGWRALGITGAPATPEPCVWCGERVGPPWRMKLGRRVIVLEDDRTLCPQHLGERPRTDPVARLERVDNRAALTRVGHPPVPLADGLAVSFRPGLIGRVRAGEPLAVSRTLGAPSPPAPGSTPQCARCRAPLYGGWWELSHGTERWCPSCFHGSPRCAFCARPAGSAGYPDGRHACASCWERGVRDSRALAPLQRQARVFMRDELGMRLLPPEHCVIELATPSELASLAGRSVEVGSPLATRGLFSCSKLPGSVVTVTHASILVEHGLPIDQVFGVIAHELTHLWQAQRFPMVSDARWLEGLACWVQGLALQALGANEEAVRTQSRTDPVYGEGLIAVTAVARRVGTRATPAEIARLAAVGPPGP